VSSRQYAFYSVARDLAGNVEVKNGTDSDPGASIVLPDKAAPVTQVSTVDAAVSTMVVTMQGTDVGASGLAYFDLYVSVDGGSAAKVGRFAAGPADVQGVSTAIATYKARADGIQRTYRFFTRGIDAANNTEGVPASPADVLLSAAYATPQLTTFDVQPGQSQRSFVGHLDLVFSDPGEIATILAGINDATSSNDRMRLRRFGLSGSGSAAAVSLVGKGSANGSTMSLDFGTPGLNTDGYYELSLDSDGNGTFETIRRFYRLQGDFNGDRIVNAADGDLLTTALGAGSPDTYFDLTGDGVVDATDQSKLTTLLGRQLGAGLLIDD
jgi:hypothetical protein